MKTLTTHTPTPWSLTNTGLIMAPDGRHSIHSCIDNVGISNGDAAFIVRAVNTHEELLKCAKSYHQELIAQKLGHKDRANCCSVTKAIAKAEKR